MLYITYIMYTHATSFINWPTCADAMAELRVSLADVEATEADA